MLKRSHVITMEAVDNPLMWAVKRPISNKVSYQCICFLMHIEFAVEKQEEPDIKKYKTIMLRGEMCLWESENRKT